MKRRQNEWTLWVSELYSTPTIQGEGMSLGRPATFLRLAGCNLTCQWCDTPYSWNWKKYPVEATTRMAIEEVVRWFLAQDIDLLVITGGEPLLQQRGIIRFLSDVQFPRDVDIEIETNGTVPPDPWLVWHPRVRFNVSPKLSNSGIPREKRIIPKALVSFPGKTVWKFVVASPSDLDEVDEVVKEFQLPRSQVYIMPEGTDANEVNDRLRLLVDHVISRRYRLTPRLHIQLWGKERGK